MDALVALLPPTQLVRDLHGASRQDFEFHSLSNTTFPTFSAHETHAEHERQRRYVEGVVMVVLMPLLLVALYLVVEACVRLVAACCSCWCFRDRGVPGERLTKTRRWWVAAVLLSALVGASVVYAVVLAGRAGTAGDGVVASIKSARGLLDNMNATASDARALAEGVAATANQVLSGGFGLPPDVERATRRVASGADAAASAMDEVASYIRYISLRSVQHHTRHALADVYGSWSGMSWLTIGMGVVALASASAHAASTDRRRSTCRRVVLLCADVAAALAILTLVVVGLGQVALTVAAADVCVAPIPTAGRVVAAHVDGRGLAAAEYYIFCDNDEHPSPFAPLLARADAAVAGAREADHELTAYAAEHGDDRLKGLARGIHAQLATGVSRVTAVEAAVQCEPVRSHGNEGFNAACGRMETSVFNFGLAQVSAALALLLLRAATLYRCCRCCHRAKGTGGGAVDSTPLLGAAGDSGGGGTYAYYSLADPGAGVQAGGGV